jgi:AcrR family transcriptional regulator
MAAQARTPRTTWIDAGLRALAAGGPEAVRVDILAQQLGITRGSFYWHFEDRAAFLDALLDSWERKSTDEVLRQVESKGGGTREKVWHSGILTFSKELLPIDLAVRDWARRDKSVAKRLRRVDNRRMDHLRALIGALWTDPVEIEARSVLAFSLAVGHHLIAADQRTPSTKQLLKRATELLLAETAEPSEE